MCVSSVCYVAYLKYRRETVETVIHSDNDFATVAYLKVKRARLVQKSSSTLAAFNVPSPPILNDVDEAVHKAVLNTKPGLLPFLPVNLPTTHRHQNFTNLPQVGNVGPWVVITNVESTAPSGSVEEEMRNCFVTIQGVTECFSHHES